jgi:hypothetical protein
MTLEPGGSQSDGDRHIGGGNRAGSAHGGTALMTSAKVASAPRGTERARIALQAAVAAVIAAPTSESIAKLIAARTEFGQALLALDKERPVYSRHGRGRSSIGG